MLLTWYFTMPRDLLTLTYIFFCSGRCSGEGERGHPESLLGSGEEKEEDSSDEREEVRLRLGRRR